MIKVFTIGFTKKTAEDFFTKLKASGVNRLLDVRLNNVSQLAGFAKRDDLRYFLKTIADIEYEHVLDLAPTDEMLDAYKKNGGKWEVYERAFLELMASRHIETKLPQSLLDGSCLLCSEHLPKHCHRRLAIEYLQKQWGDLSIVHIT